MANKNTRTLLVLGGCISIVVVMGSFPMWSRKNTGSLIARDKLSGSQTQRGMFMNFGSTDAGVDPNWDPVTRSYKNQEDVIKIRSKDRPQ